MRRVAIVGAVMMIAAGSSSAAADIGPVSRVTENNHAGSYVTAAGGTDAVSTGCATTRREQLEPTVAVDPANPNVVSAGAIDTCLGATSNGFSWDGLYRSTDGGRTWIDSLVPGYPGDTSSAGQQSPAAACPAYTADPSLAYGRHGTLYYAFECADGTIYVAKYDAGGHYVRTVVARSSTDAYVEDKPNLTVDRTRGPHSGTVYLSWTRDLQEGGETTTLTMSARSIDGGQSFAEPVQVGETTWDPGVDSDTFSDQAIGPDGALYVVFRAQSQIMLGRSTDGGASFGSPATVADYERLDTEQWGEGGHTCGSGPFACSNGFHTAKFRSLPTIAADRHGVHVLWAGKRAGGQGRIYFRNSPDGVDWSSPVGQLDQSTTGHQILPDLASGAGVLTAVFYDSRRDPAYSPDRPPGNRPDGTWSGGGFDAMIATSRDGGVHWQERRVTKRQINWGYPAFEPSLRFPFYGDYIYVSAAGTHANAVWVDTRDLVPGTDPRESHPGFDVYAPCLWDPNDINSLSYNSPANAGLNDLLLPHTDACYNQGGLDLNIYSVRVNY